MTHVILRDRRDDVLAEAETESLSGLLEELAANGADLRGVALTGADLLGVALRDADLRGAALANEST